MTSENPNVKGADSDIPSNNTQCFNISDIRQKLRDASYRRKLFYSLWIAGSLFTLGVTASQGGPTFLDLQLITNTKMEEASVFFTVQSVGILTGSLVYGLIGSKIDQRLMTFLSMAVLGASSVATPYSYQYGLMIAVRSLNGFCIGLVNTGGNAQHMRIWGDDGRSLMQFLHFVCAFGSLLSPLFTEPFLATPIEPARNESYPISQIGLNVSNATQTPVDSSAVSYFHGQTQYINITGILGNSTSDSDTINVKHRTGNIQFAFIITGLITWLASIPFIVMYIRDRSVKQNENRSKNTEVNSRQIPRRLYGFILALLCAFSVSYNYIEVVFSSFLMTFLVREYDFVSKSKGAYVTALFFASFAISRFLMIFVSKVLVPVRLLIMCGILTVISAIGFTVSATFSSLVFMSVFTAVAGMGMSAIFPATLSWSMSELLIVTPFISSCVFVSHSIGGMVFPLLVAFLMGKFCNMWFCYLNLIATGVLSVLFIFLLLFNRIFINKRFGPLYAPRPKQLIVNE